MKNRLVPLSRRIYSADEVSLYLKQVGIVEWVTMGKVLDDVCDACVDGRDTQPIIGNPGGDIVRLTEAVVAIGRLTGIKLSPVMLDDVFRWYVATFGTVYMHTDEHAMHALLHDLAHDKSIKLKAKTVEELMEYVMDPPDARVHMRLSRYLVDEKYVGCGHIRLMLTRPEIYEISQKVLRYLMFSYFDNLWNGSAEIKKKLIFRMLTGDHSEGAVLSVVVPDKELIESTKIPMVAPSNGEMTMFVVHPQVSEYLSIEVAKALAKSGIFPHLSIDPKELAALMHRFHNEGARETVSILAGGLPQYTFELAE